jgi:hypothetical protein
MVNQSAFCAVAHPTSAAPKAPTMEELKEQMAAALEKEKMKEAINKANGKVLPVLEKTLTEVTTYITEVKEFLPPAFHAKVQDVSQEFTRLQAAANSGEAVQEEVKLLTTTAKNLMTSAKVMEKGMRGMSFEKQGR